MEVKNEKQDKQKMHKQNTYINIYLLTQVYNSLM